jgi:uncharacterized protein YndB with AHSA1/START domain
MSTFRYTVEVFASPQRVWETLVDVERWPEWTPTVTRAERLEPGPLALGSRTKLWQPQLMTTAWRVTALDSNAGVFIWETSRPGVKVIATHRVEPTQGGVRLSLALEYKGILGGLMAIQLKDLNWDYLTKEAQGLKARCEA